MTNVHSDIKIDPGSVLNKLATKNRKLRLIKIVILMKMYYKS